MPQRLTWCQQFGLQDLHVTHFWKADASAADLCYLETILETSESGWQITQLSATSETLSYIGMHVTVQAV